MPAPAPHLASGVSAPHHAFWPPALPRHLTLPQTHLFHNVQVSAARFPDKPFIVYYDTPLRYADFATRCEHLAGHLQQVCGVKRGDRVLLYLQNSPQWVIGYYAILRADAVVVPVNPMNRCEELRHYVEDTGASTAIVAQDLLDELLPLHRQAEGGLQHLVVATYADHLQQATDLRLPEGLAAPRRALRGLGTGGTGAGLVAWADALAAGRQPGPMQAGPDDLAVMPYTSGTTGAPKGCMHTHRSVMSTLVGGVQWFGCTQDTVYLSVLPFFHVTGMSGSMNGPIYAGATIVLLTRWDREVAAACIARYRVTLWQVISTMMVDFLSLPGIEQVDLSSLTGIRGGGAAMPEAVALKFKALTGLAYAEGYGMSETMAATHINPPQRAKPQCLGIPVFDVDARLVDPATLAEVAPGDSGEIVVHGPQVMQGYWNAPEANAQSFVTLAGKRFLRTGDLARIDEDGYFFMVDRLKRMINASGYKVWPAEVEALMYRHPAILEACVIASRDARRGETVKALVVLKPGHQGQVSEGDIVQWCHAHMAVYKSPRIVQFVPALPKSGSGKVQWRELQALEDAGAAVPAAFAVPVPIPTPETNR